MNQQTGLRLMRAQHSLLRNCRSSQCGPKQTHQAATAAVLSLRRHASNSTAASAAAAAKTSKPETEAVITPLDASTVSSPKAKTFDPDVDISATLNPPASTRPPPLDLPTREPDASMFSYYYKLGKAYMAFYKTGLKAIYTNRKLLSEVNHVFQGPPGLAKQPAGSSPIAPTRAAVLLRERTSHDLARLPVFGVLVLVAGEFTPLLVLLFPTLTPLTCRIPKQTAKLREKAQRRREASLWNLRHVAADDAAGIARVAPGHVARSLNLGLALWDKMGVDLPFVQTRVQRAVRRIVADDFRIRDGGGVGGLVDEEVVMACEDRAMDVAAHDSKALRKKLAKWIGETTAKDEAAGEAAIQTILLRREN
ncbi:letm1-like protein [Apiospora kogelbergensis]|uniref:Letm1-like protein n=1 Tax=Apiospora kogelbergensis TaxID=1337665 RepID=A0AAW0QH39_9PEZI